MLKPLSAIPWSRVLVCTFVIVMSFSFAMSLMTIYRLTLLPNLVNFYCANATLPLVCTASVVETLLYDSQWMALQFLVYFTLVLCLLWPLLKHVKGNPLLNSFAIALLSTALLTLMIERAGIEFYASTLCPLFVGLLLKVRRQRQITENQPCAT